MKRKTCVIFLLIVCLSVIIDDVDGGWKFWKKKDKNNETESTGAPELSSTPTPIIQSTPTTARSGTTSKNQVDTKKALTGLADPGLVIGVGSTGQNIKQNPRPSQPNAATDVGFDYPSSKSKPETDLNGDKYRGWAAELTGAGEPSQPGPKLPSQGPAFTNKGERPTSLPGNVSPQPQGNRPTSLPSNPAITPTPGAKQPPALGPRPTSPVETKPQVPTSHIATSTSAPTNKINVQQPIGVPQRNDPQQPGATSGSNINKSDFPSLPKTGSTVPPNSPIGSRSGSPSWADVASSGSRPNSPTSSTGGPNQRINNTPKPLSGSTILAGGAGVAAGAAAAAAATTANKKVYSSNPTYSKGKTITDEDLEKLSEALFIKDTGNLMKHITLNLQKQTTSSSDKDEATQPLFTISPEAFQIATVQKVMAIYDNYNPDQRVNEYISPAQRQEESILVDTFLSTNVMSTAMRFLADKEIIRKDYYDYKDTLRRLWFNLYSRGEGKIGSTGFEHVFVHEEKLDGTKTEIAGLHNWIYFSTEEKKNKVNYLGYMKKVDLGTKAAILKVHAKYNGFDKPTMTMFVGTSPELEMALYTVCYYARPDQNCPVSFDGVKFNIATYKFKYRGNDLISTAYPSI